RKRLKAITDILYRYLPNTCTSYVEIDAVHLCKYVYVYTYTDLSLSFVLSLSTCIQMYVNRCIYRERIHSLTIREELVGL
ncbi:hypothetical protein CSUI_008190, partial [Cystoisospora suis]